jgi:anti-sigma factor RsiW
MTHHIPFDTLNDFADELLAEPERAAVARHLSECAPCAEALAKLRRVLAMASQAPRAIEPPNDLWPELRSKVGQQTVVTRSWFAGRERMWLAAAALLLVVGSSAITALVMRNRTTGVTTQVAVEPPRPIALPAALMQTDAGYRLALSELAGALDSARTRLSPKTVETVERSLRVIDQAIAEARDALAHDPGNQTLIDVLSSSYERKLELLRRVSEIPSKS